MLKKGDTVSSCFHTPSPFQTHTNYRCILYKDQKTRQSSLWSRNGKEIHGGGWGRGTSGPALGNEQTAGVRNRGQEATSTPVKTPPQQLKSGTAAPKGTLGKEPTGQPGCGLRAQRGKGRKRGRERKLPVQSESLSAAERMQCEDRTRVNWTGTLSRSERFPDRVWKIVLAHLNNWMDEYIF